jgi:hypothetical protein
LAWLSSSGLIPYVVAAPPDAILVGLEGREDGLDILLGFDGLDGFEGADDVVAPKSPVA